LHFSWCEIAGGMFGPQFRAGIRQLQMPDDHLRNPQISSVLASARVVLAHSVLACWHDRLKKLCSLFSSSIMSGSCILCFSRYINCRSRSDCISPAICDSSEFHHGLAAAKGLQIFAACSLASEITLVRAEAALSSSFVERVLFLSSRRCSGA